jgi:hypothetical protein
MTGALHSFCFSYSSINSRVQSTNLSIYRGAALAYRVALWHPELVTHIITVCVPYAAPTRRYFPLEDMVERIAPHFYYQLQFINGELDEYVQTKEDIKRFLSAMYGGRTTENEVAFDAELGILPEKMARVLPSELLSEEVRFYSY